MRKKNEKEPYKVKIGKTTYRFSHLSMINREARLYDRRWNTVYHGPLGEDCSFSGFQGEQSGIIRRVWQKIVDKMKG